MTSAGPSTGDAIELEPTRVLVTGGLGFIGSAVIRQLVAGGRHQVLNVDVGTYAATEGSVAEVATSDRYQRSVTDITDGPALRAVVDDFEPDAIIHLAAETHVDRSIDGPGTFIATNIMGTYELLQAARASAGRRGILDRFRFLHVSTDEVFGALGLDDEPFTEATRYDPRSPYSASKASADHLVRAWYETYGLPVIVTNCSNNYGPFQFPEKLIPLMVLKAAAGERLPVYDRGQNVRDWLHVDDHAAGIIAALDRGRPGRTYLFGGESERSNLQVVEAICDLVEDRVGPLDGPIERDVDDPVERPVDGEVEPRARRALIEFVADRPGHDLRYAVDCSRAKAELGWTPTVPLADGLAATVDWYLGNEAWWAPLTDRRYDGSRLGQLPRS